MSNRMDALSEKRLEEISDKFPYELTEEDKAFLRARRDYLSRDQRERFADALVPPVVVEAQHVETVVEEKLDGLALSREAKALGLTWEKGTPAAVIKRMIDDHKREQAIEAERVAEAQKQKEADEKAAQGGHSGNFSEQQQEAAETVDIRETQQSQE